MPRVLLVIAFCACLNLAQSASGQTLPTLTITDAEPRFYLLQPFYATTAAARHKIYHIGIEASRIADTFVVRALLDGYPAQQAGVRRGDRLLSVNDKPFDPLRSFEPALDSTATATAMPVSLQLARADQLLTFDLSPVFENLYDSRRSASLDSIQEFTAGNKTIAYFHPWALSRNLNDLLSFIQVIEDLALSDGLILDLRDSYGFMSVQHLDAFLPTRLSLTAVTGPSTSLTQIDEAAASLVTRHYGKPVAILINAGTAGGAELLAYQLALLDRITTIGETTAGELGVYEYLDGPDSQVLQYLPAENAAVDGIPLTEFRVDPELVIEYPLSLTTRSDPQFEAAFNLLLGRI